MDSKFYWASVKFIEDLRPKGEINMKAILLSLLFIFLFNNNAPVQSPRQTTNVSYDSQSKSIIVPVGNEKTIITDGIISKEEWDSAIVFQISEYFQNLFVFQFSQ